MTTEHETPSQPEKPFLSPSALQTRLVLGMVVLMIGVGGAVLLLRDGFNWWSLGMGVFIFLSMGLLGEAWETVGQQRRDSMTALLRAGAFAALLAAGFQVAVAVLTRPGDPKSFQLPFLLHVVGAVPWLVVVLPVLYQLALLAENKALKTSILCNGAANLASVLLYCSSQEWLANWVMITFLVLGGLAAVSALYFLQEAYPKWKWSWEWLGGVAVLCSLILYWRLGFPDPLAYLLGIAFFTLAFALVFDLIVAPIWLGVCLIQERRRLGGGATLLGGAQILSVLFMLILVGMLIDTLIHAFREEVAEDDWYVPLTTMDALRFAVLAILTASFFLTVQYNLARRSPPTSS
jgi:hypothetical protein